MAAAVAGGLVKAIMGLLQLGVANMRKTLLMQIPGIAELCLFGFCVGAALRVRPVKAYSWLHHLVMVYLTGFAGSTFTPMFFGRPPVMFINDLIVPLVCIAWYMVHHSYLSKYFAGRSFVYPLVIVPYEIFRANMIMKTVNLAASEISPSIYYPIPIFGPILVGTLYGTLGAFMPFDRHLTWIQGGVPQPLQMTFLGCAFYHLALNDPHLVGAYLRGLPLLNLKDSDNLRAIVVVFFVSSALVSWAMGSDFNVLEPLHRVLYTLTGLPLSPRTEEALRTRKAAAPTSNGTTDGDKKGASATPSASKIGSVTKIAVPVAAILAHMFWAGPRTTLRAGERLAAGDFVTSCSLWDRYAKSCKPHYVTINNEGNLALFKGDSPQTRKKELVWASKSKRRVGGLSEKGFYAELADDGALNVKHRDCSMVYWTSAKRAPAGKGAPVLKVQPDGTLGIFAGDETVWVSE